MLIDLTSCVTLTLPPPAYLDFARLITFRDLDICIALRTPLDLLIDFGKGTILLTNTTHSFKSSLILAYIHIRYILHSLHQYNVTIIRTHLSSDCSARFLLPTWRRLKLSSASLGLSLGGLAWPPSVTSFTKCRTSQFLSGVCFFSSILNNI